MAQISYTFNLSIFYILTIFLPYWLASPALLSNESDMLALLQFKAGIAGEAINSWNDSIPFCKWNGVTCGRRHQRVTSIDLQSLNLAGSISPYIGNLSFLRELLLQENSFTQEIPRELGRLRRLETLDLRNNSLTGGIPANLSRCLNLISIRLENNPLKGKLPPDFGSLTKLEVLSARNTSLVGDIPSSFGNLSSLVQLRLAYNNLRGDIPPTLGQLKNLKVFGIGGSDFSGNIPTSMFNISSMEMFDVGENMLQGTLPSYLGINWPNLTYFSISVNQFTGSIPSSISNASNLIRIYLPSNNLTGRVPSLEKLVKLQHFAIGNNSLGFGGENDLSFLTSLTNATTLDTLEFGTNNFGGEVPESIANLSSTLTRLVMQTNKLVGRIPTAITNLAGLQALVMTGNLLSGDIPRDIGNLRELGILFLGDNELTGSIPSSIGNLDKLFRLYLTSNKLVGTIPPHLGNCTSLLGLSIAQNRLSGHIPFQIFNITSLAVHLNMFQNQLTGSLPREVGNLKHIVRLDVSRNKLSGEIPASLGGCASLEELYMMDNSFQGAIPSSLSSLGGLDSLDLSRNNLSGEIPRFLQGFIFLQYLNLSFNSFIGAVPSEGVFKNVTAISIEGNDELCGGTPKLQLPPCKFNEPAKSRRRCEVKIILVTVLTFAGASMVIGSSLLFWLRKREKNIVLDSLENSLLQVSYRTLFKSTDGFSPSNLIGMGYFGSVYKGTLDDERIVAVKVFNLQQRGGFKSFTAECEAMKNIRHRNLVKVITSCSSVDIQGNDFKALVYEFMINGSLEEWLHPIDSRDKMTFIQRLNIVIDVASAIYYLHHQCSQTPVVHCDLKPSNVLLDDVMTAQVGDFGLVKFLDEGTPVDQISSIGVRGTVGYAAPEYGMGSGASTQGDVYSYGILILEMFTGKRPTDDMFTYNLNLHRYVKMALLENVANVADPILLENTSSDEENQKVIESLVLILEVGAACSEEVLRERMDISDAVAKLTSIRLNLIANGGRGNAAQSATDDRPQVRIND